MKSVYEEKIDHEAYHRLENMFAEGYRMAGDKLVYLRLAHIPFELSGDQSGPDAHLHLKSVNIEEAFEVGNVAPAFGSNQLIHQMYPHELVETRLKLKFVYVYHGGVVEKPLHELLGLVIEDSDNHS